VVVERPGGRAGYRIHGWGGPLVWDDLPERRPGSGEVLVEVDACGIGLTVLNCINGNLSDDPALLPRVPGHELAGRVVALGAGAEPSLLGRSVVAYFYLHCGECANCVGGMEPRCLRLGGWVGVHRDGGYGPTTVLPQRNVVVIPDAVDPVEATVIPDAVATPVHVSRRAEIGAADRVAVLGAGGGVGAHMVQVARLHGAAVIGLERNPEKLATLEGLGVTAAPVGDSLPDPASLFGGARPTVVVDLVGAAATLAWSVSAVAPGGRVVLLTTFRDVTTRLDPRELVFAESSIMGSRYASVAEVAEAATLVADGRIRPVIGTVVDPDGVPAVHEAIRGGSLVGRGALRWR